MRRALLLLIVAAAACKHDADAPSPSPAPPPASGSAVAPAHLPPDELDEKMRYCPVTQPGVRTELAEVDGGIQLAMHVAPPADVAKIEELAHHVADFAAGRAAKGRHGNGTGGGRMRNCPIVTQDTTIVATETADGATLVVSPKDPAKLADLRAMTHERFDRAPLERAQLARTEQTDAGETRLYDGAVADLDGDGQLELVAVGFAAAAGGGHRSTVRIYRKHGDAWDPVTEAGWDDGGAANVRDVQVADVDGDGKPDIVVLGRVGATSHEARARLAVFDLAGDKLVQKAEIEWQHGEYTHGYGLAVADLDGDHVPEIVTGGFQFDGKVETGYVRVWTLTQGALALHAETTIDGAGEPSMRVNDVAIGDLDGDGHPDIVVAGRHSPLKTEDSKEHLDQRRETGDLVVLGYAHDKLTPKTRFAWTKGSSLRVRTVAIADLGGHGAGDHHADLVAGGQYDADGKPCLALFGMDHGKLVLRDDTAATGELAGEIKDLAIAGHGADARVLATGVTGEKPGRQSDVVAWRVAHGKLARDERIVSRNGDETRARSVIVTPDGQVLTIGHAKRGAAMVGQVLAWPLASAAKSL